MATTFEDPDGNRRNEGAIGPDGSIWIGTMQTNLDLDSSMRVMDRSSGARYRVAPAGTVQRITDDSSGIMNTLAWNESRGQMVLGEILRQTQFRTTCSAVDSMLTQDKWAVTKDHGFPDAACIDGCGCVWNTRIAGGRLIRYGPNRSVGRQRELQATKITARIVGAPDRHTLNIATATNKLPVVDLPATDVGVRDPKTYRFGI